MKNIKRGGGGEFFIWTELSRSYNVLLKKREAISKLVF